MLEWAEFVWTFAKGNKAPWYIKSNGTSVCTLRVGILGELGEGQDGFRKGEGKHALVRSNVIGDGEDRTGIESPVSASDSTCR